MKLPKLSLNRLLIISGSTVTVAIISILGYFATNTRQSEQVLGTETNNIEEIKLADREDVVEPTTVITPTEILTSTTTPTTQVTPTIMTTPKPTITSKPVQTVVSTPTPTPEAPKELTIEEKICAKFPNNCEQAITFAKSRNPTLNPTNVRTPQAYGLFTIVCTPEIIEYLQSKYTFTSCKELLSDVDINLDVVNQMVNKYGWTTAFKSM